MAFGAVQAASETKILSHIESFHGSLKQEYIWPHDFSNYQEAEAVISEAFRDYNRSRLHSALKYVPPDEFLASWEAKHK